MEFKAQIDEQKIQEELNAWLEKRTKELVAGIVSGWDVRESIEKKAKVTIDGQLDEVIAAALAKESGSLAQRVDKTLDSIIKSKVKKATK